MELDRTRATGGFSGHEQILSRTTCQLLQFFFDSSYDFQFLLEQITWGKQFNKSRGWPIDGLELSRGSRRVKYMVNLSFNSQNHVAVVYIFSTNNRLLSDVPLFIQFSQNLANVDKIICVARSVYCLVDLSLPVVKCLYVSGTLSRVLREQRFVKGAQERGVASSIFKWANTTSNLPSAGRTDRRESHWMRFIATPGRVSGRFFIPTTFRQQSEAWPAIISPRRLLRSLLWQNRNIAYTLSCTLSVYKHM